jgi:hypothetical protein
MAWGAGCAAADVRVPTWIAEPPVRPLAVRWAPAARAALLALPPSTFRLFPDAAAAAAAIEDVLRSDPRSVGRRHRTRAPPVPAPAHAIAVAGPADDVSVEEVPSPPGATERAAVDATETTASAPSAPPAASVQGDPAAASATPAAGADHVTAADVGPSRSHFRFALDRIDVYCWFGRPGGTTADTAAPKMGHKSTLEGGEEDEEGEEEEAVVTVTRIVLLPRDLHVTLTAMPA